MAAIALSSTAYTQSFDGLLSSGTNITWTNDSTIPGWYASQTTGTLANYDTGTGSSNAGGLYSFGTNGFDSIERALGAVSSNSTGTVLYGVRLVNNTSNTVTGLNIRYTGEQWRDSGAGTAQTVNFQYQVGASNLTAGTWTPFSSLDFTSPVFSSATGVALNGNLLVNQTALSSTLSVSVAPNQEIWLRWSDVDHTSGDHGLAIDNFSVSAITASSQPVPEPMDFMGTIVAIFAVAILKRKFSARKTAR
jgi:uncharacterized protein